MKKILFFILCANILSAQTAQDVIEQTDNITIREDTLYFLTSTIITENGTDYPDTNITNQFLGDSTQAATFLYNQAWDKANFLSSLMRRAFQRNDLYREYNNLADLFFDVTNKTLLLENQEQQFAFYHGRYRITALEPSPFFVNIIQLPSGALRMEREDNGTRYPFNPRNRNFFLVTIGGESYAMHYAGDNPNELRTYEEELKVTGPRPIFITKL